MAIKTHSVYYPLYEDKEHFVFLVTGGRGCEHPDTPIMMADRSVKKIKDIQVGDCVMGDDGTPRCVLGLFRGNGKMYEVWQHCCHAYKVNDSHILSLHNKHTQEDEDIPLPIFLSFTKAKRGEYISRNYYHAGSEIKIKPIGNGDWRGIMLNGNQRYLHADGTITHNSGKSYSASTFIERLTFEYNAAMKVAHQILYTRYTMVSAAISVIPEVLEKIEAEGTDMYFKRTRTDIKNRMTGATVMFRGINTSSGNQTAKLKSIHGVTTFVVDEAEEWTSEDDFERIMLSIRQQGLQNRIIIIMNPADSNHWVYRRFIEKTHRIEYFDGVPVQISTHPDVCHIHTTYLDNVENLSPEFLKEVLSMKENDPERYAHIVMGRWADVAEGAVFKHIGIVDKFPEQAKMVARAMDIGYTHDPTAIVRCGIIGNRLYIDELCYKTGMTANDIIKELVDEEERGEDGFVYSESADPRLVDEIALGGIIIYPVKKGPGSILAGITKMQGYEIFVTRRSVNAQNEFRNYVWAKDKDGYYINEPEDHDNHCFVGDTIVSTPDGGKRIDEIKGGDMVCTSAGSNRVTKVFDQGTKKAVKVRLTFADEEIEVEATPDHLFKTDRGWVQLCHLCVGDVLSLYRPEFAVERRVIIGIETVRERMAQVYDIEVEGAHEFFANGILAHNCIDASRYFVLGKILGRIMQPKAVTKDELGIY